MTKEELQSLPIPSNYRQLESHEIIKAGDRYVSSCEFVNKYQWDNCSYSTIGGVAGNWDGNLRFITPIGNNLIYDIKVGDKVKIKLAFRQEKLRWDGDSYLVGCEGCVSNIIDVQYFLTPITTWKNGTKYTCVLAKDELEPLNISSKERENRLREESKLFVKQYITNPNKTDFARFESAFLKGGDFGM